MRDERPISEVAIEALVLGRHGDPFALLGPHREGEGWVIRALLPRARAVTALARSGETLAACR
jgi:1,4-alpha-glucan branching enzyme